MGRGRVQLRRIENKVSRQVTFSKRRAGLLKKAEEISVLCDVDVALIIFSTKGKLCEYATNSSMERILGRYEQYRFAERELTAADLDSQGNCTLEYIKLKSKVEFLLKRQRQLKGEDLESLCTKELQHLEHQLETGLKQIRARKNHLLFDSLSELEGKEKMLQDENNLLQKKLREKEKEKEALSLHAHSELQENPPATRSALPPDLNFMEPLSTDIGIHQGRGMAKQRQIVWQNHTGNSELPAWMLRLANG